MNDLEQRKAAKQFATYWENKGYEKGESQPFWMALLHEVYGVEHPEQYIMFENQVHLDHTSFIDAYIPTTKVLIEQKGFGKDLNKAIKQSDGTLLTPFQQAKRYITELPVSKHPRWVITCNFEKFQIYDMERPGGNPEVLYLKDLSKEYYRLSFLVDTENEHFRREMEVSIAAGDIVGEIYDAFSKQYVNPDSVESLKSLNILCVRLVFCLYAEDAGLFGRHNMFHDYLAGYKTRELRRALKDLFKVLDTKPEDRDPYLKDDNPTLAAFPYVNGGLFADENIEIPPFTDEIKELLIKHASSDFDWSEISPTIFGAVFESTLNPETRRSGGMHYTSIENIHKVIDPLFLDELKKELEVIKCIQVERTQKRKLREYQKKISELTFLDPACGSGNFLTETYLSLRRIENEVIRLSVNGQMTFGFEYANPIMVSINQFYGIEINDFAATVAKTALWIAESQMMKETEEILLMNLDFLPLKSYTNIVEGNALKIKWENIVRKENLDYIMGNPPFLGYSMQSAEQKKDILSIYVDENGKTYRTSGKIDYVSGWYFKAIQFMQNTKIKTAFVSTNSITQGEQVASVWKPLYERFTIQIEFAYKTFRWDSEANIKAHVHCVIVGFSAISNMDTKTIYDGNKIAKVEAINPYLLPGETVFIESRKKPLCDVIPMSTGNRPADGGKLIIEADEYEEFILKEPKAKKYIKKLTGAAEYINGKKRYCLWLVDVSPHELMKMPYVMKRIEECRQDRLQGAPDRQKLANTPFLFRETKNPKSYIIIPRVSSERRRYIPLGFLDEQTIPTDSATIIENAGLYEFGILTSNVHMSWMRAVGGRLKSDYRYSKDIVYNNFPWPTCTEEQKEKVSSTAKKILDARKLYSHCTLSEMYGEQMYLFPELLKAHQNNDRVVMKVYGFSVKDMTEASCVVELMKMYQKLMEKK